ncbi:MAG: 50S ribosomal protein L18 [Candidatus Hadarchaeales archaeon]
MKFGPRYRVPFRRRREGKTDYRKRLRLCLSGKPRLVVRLTNRRIICQIIKFDPKGDIVLASADSKELRKFGWKGGANTPAAYLTGLLCGKRALKAGVKETVLDLGLHSPTKGSRIFAALKGALDAGLSIPHDPEVLPPPERISGEHVAEYASQARERFSEYLERGLDPQALPQHVQELKNTLEKLE